MLKAKIILLCLFCVLGTVSIAQEKGTNKGIIKGVVIDSTTSESIELATVVILKDNNKKIFQGTTTDNKGEFGFYNLNDGNYVLKVTGVNFFEKSFDIVLTKKNSEIDLGKILVNQKSYNLQSVEVTATKEAIEYGFDRMIVNVEKTLPSAGGSAIDVLRNTPSVNVDIDNNVSLRGNSNINIQVDGRQSGISDPKMLEQIPASVIEKIEIITNPSARYDAEGSAGIINIVMKKRQEVNFNGLVNLNAGTRDNYSGSMNFNYRYDGWNINGSYDNRFNSRSGSGFGTKNTTLSNNVNTTWGTTNSMKWNGNSHNVKLGIDYSMDKYNTFSVSGLYNIGKNRFNRGAKTLYDSADVNISSYDNLIIGNRDGLGYDANLGYKRTFDTQGQELTIDFQYSKNSHDEGSDRKLIYFTQESVITSTDLQNTDNENFSDNYTFKTDYVHPFNEDSRFEIGFKSVIRDRRQEYVVLDYIDNIWINDITYSNNFDYNEQINAAYAIWSNKIGGFKYQLGLRSEQTNTQSNQETQNLKYSTSYIDFFPTMHIGYEFVKGQETKLSYSRRIQRPRGQMINPFVREIDEYTRSAGNPYLKPEYIDSYEFGNNLIIDKSSLFGTIFYRRVNNNMDQYTILRPDNISYSTFKNALTQVSYGIELNASSQILKWWNINAGYSYYLSKFEGQDPEIFNSGKTNDFWTGRISTSITLPLEFSIQFNGYYNSGFASAQSKMKGNFFTDLGIRKSFMDNKLVLNFRVSDVFNSMKFESEERGYNFYSIQNNKMNNQIFTFGLSYNINNYKRNRDRTGENTERESDSGTDPMGL